jgi:hypothetical protein
VSASAAIGARDPLERVAAAANRTMKGDHSRPASPWSGRPSTATLVERDDVR